MYATAQFYRNQTHPSFTPPPRNRYRAKAKRRRRPLRRVSRLLAALIAVALALLLPAPPQALVAPALEALSTLAGGGFPPEAGAGQPSGSGVQLEVETIPQLPELPNGCEITSAAIALNYLGFGADKCQLAAEYLPTGPLESADPDREYMGDPFSQTQGWFCYAGPVVQAVNAYLDDQGQGGYRALDLTGCDFDTVLGYLDEGLPVLCWATVGMQQIRYIDGPDGSPTYGNLHCVVLTGYTGSQVYLADPLDRTPEYSREQFALLWQEMGCRAVVICPQ